MQEIRVGAPYSTLRRGRLECCFTFSQLQEKHAFMSNTALPWSDVAKQYSWVVKRYLVNLYLKYEFCRQIPPPKKDKLGYSE